MTTYTISGYRLDETGDTVDDVSVSELVFVLPDSQTTIRYSVDTPNPNDFPDVSFDEIDDFVIDGVLYEGDREEIDVSIGELTWDGGNTTILLNIYDNRDDTSFVYVLGGDPIPASNFASAAATQNFIDNLIEGTAEATGDFAPDTDILLSSLDNTTSAASDFTTYTISGFRLDETGDNVDAVSPSELTFTLPDEAVGFFYTVDDFNSDNEPLIIIDGITNVLIDGAPAPDGPLIDDTIIAVTWGDNDNVSIVLNIYDNNTETSFVYVIGGDDIPASNFATPQAAMDFIASISGTAGATGDFGPNTLIEFDDLLNTTSVGLNLVQGTDGDDNLVGTSGDDLILGLDGEDTLDGQDGDDTLNGGDGENYYRGSNGSDTYELEGDGNYAQIDYGGITGPIVVNLNSITETGTVEKTGTTDTDTLTDLNDPTKGFGGFGIGGTNANDTFNITFDSGAWIQVNGGRGQDSYNIDVTQGGNVRLDFRRDTNGIDPNDGIDVDLSTNTVHDDGWGNTETITGQVWEIRGTVNDDDITGSDNDESFILHAGDDVLDAGGGYDRLRYDRSGVDAVNINLDTGVGTGVWNYRGDEYNFTHDISGVEWVRGSRDGNDTLTAGSVGVRFEGLGGNDTLNGSDQDDQLEGGDGDDTLNGNGGDDFLRGGEGNDVLNGGDGDDDFGGGNGDDTHNGGDGDDYFNSSAGLDSYDGGAGDFDQISYVDEQNAVTVDLSNNQGTDGDGNVETLLGIEMVRGSNFADTITGDSGNNQIRGIGGADTLDGGAGIDLIRYDRDDRYGGSNGVTVHLGDGQATDGFGDTDTISNFENVMGTDYGDTLTGDDGDNWLRGLAGDDTLVGGLGNDRIDGGDGNDILRGGSGDDIFENTTGLDDINGGRGIDTIIDDVTGLTPQSFTLFMDFTIGEKYAIEFPTSGNDIFTGIENYTLIGDIDTQIIGDGEQNVITTDLGEDIISGGDGNDTLNGGANNDILNGDGGRDTLNGGDGEDELNGGAGRDVLNGGDDADTLNGGDKEDILNGGQGNDTLNGDIGDDTLNGGDNTDTLNGGDGKDTLNGDKGNDTLNGDVGDDTLNGGDGKDTLNGGDGKDTLNGEVGDDVLNGNNGDDIINGGDGRDTVNGGIGGDLINGDGGNDILNGGTRKDFIYGGGKDDILNGDGGFDRLFGGGGDDILDGGTENDRLTGGSGADTFIFGIGLDRIRDFEDDIDTIQLTANLGFSGQSAQDVVDAVGSIVGTDAVLDFGNGNVLTLNGVTDLTVLYNDVEVL